MAQVDTMLWLVVGVSPEHLPILVFLGFPGCRFYLAWIPVPRCTAEVIRAAKAGYERICLAKYLILCRLGLVTVHGWPRMGWT